MRIARKLGLVLMLLAFLSNAAPSGLRASTPPEGQATKREKVYIPKLSLSTDMGSTNHWARLVDFAQRQGVSRLVFWGDMHNLYLYAKYPGLLPEALRAETLDERARMRHDAEMTKKAGLEFWFVFQVALLPELAHTRQAHPELFTPEGEPDMASERMYQLIRAQLEEMLELVPELDGVELWVMEGANVQVAHLEHQRISTEEICARIVETVYNVLAPRSKKLAIDLHTSGGDPVTRLALLKAATRHSDLLVGGDNTEGDFSAWLPFNRFLIAAAKTNPVQVHFDLNGEYWGRNFVPTSALNLYAQQIEEARKIRVIYLDGRVSTSHDTWSPYANVLPSRRKFYPALSKVSDSQPLPPDLDIASFDTLGAFNAEFFCRRARDPNAKPEDSLRDFLRREFGEKAVGLVPTFLKIEPTVRRIFFTDSNYFGFQSVLPIPERMEWNALDVHLTCSAGTEFPPPEVLRAVEAKHGYKLAFAGWPTPLGLRCAGPAAMIREKQEALAQAEEMLKEVRRGTQGLSPNDRDFLVKQFEDLVFVARAYRFTLEAMVNYYLVKGGKREGDLPDPAGFKAALEGMRNVAGQWEKRYPGGRYELAERLREWLKIMQQP